MIKLDYASIERSISAIVRLTSRNFLLSLMRVMQSDSDYPLDLELRLANACSLLAAGVSESSVLELVEDHLEGIADVRMLEYCTTAEEERKGQSPKHPVKPRDRVIVTDSNGNRFPGICVNVNDLREPSMRYAVTLRGYHDPVFCGEDQIEFLASHDAPMPFNASTIDAGAFFHSSHKEE